MYLNSNLIQAKVCFQRAQESIEQNERISHYLSASKLYLAAAEDVDDDIIKTPLIYLSASCSQMACVCRRKSSAILSRKNKANLADVLSNERLVFTNHRQRISNVKKVRAFVLIYT